MGEFTGDHTKELIIKAHNKDKQAREQLIIENMGLIWSIVKRFNGRGAEMEDLFQIGCIGLIKAVDNFCIDYDVRFSTYAVPMITGEIKRFLRDDGLIKVSRTIKENGVRCARASETLKTRYNREPTLDEIAQESGLSVEDIVITLGAGETVESLYKPVYQRDGSEICLVDKIEEKKNFGEQVLNNMVVNELLESLGSRERKLIRMRYFEDKTQTEVSKELGISQVQVSRLEKKILASMKSHL